MSEKTEFNKIPQIHIGNQGSPGRAFGGLIYSSNLEVGVNGEATKLTLNVVPDDKFSKDIQISSDNLTDQGRTTISIGNHIEMKNMILTSYSKAKSVEDKTLSLEYSDGSILFDKVYVGLLNRHYQAKAENEHEYTIEFDALCNSRHGSLSKVPSELLGQCDGKDVQLISTMVSKGATHGYGSPKNAKEHWTRKEDMPKWTENGAIIKRTYVKAGDKEKNYQIFKPSRFTGGKMEEKLDSAWDGDLFDGALVVLGREEFKESICDASMDVSYNFSDLLNNNLK